MPTPPDDVLLNKAAIIERCIRRIMEEAAAAPGLDHPTHVDALTLNVERACQAAIDMAMHVVAERRLGIPQSNAHAFQLLERDGVIGDDLAKALGGMVGFRNVAIHQYDQIDLDILHWIIKAGHRDWIRLATALGVQIRRSLSVEKAINGLFPPGRPQKSQGFLGSPVAASCGGKLYP